MGGQAVKLATLRTSAIDGELIVVSRDLASRVLATDIALTLQVALDDWASMRPRLEERFERLQDGSAPGIEPFAAQAVHAPLPRAYQWCDGSVYIEHSRRMGEWIGKTVDPRFTEEPWMYQGASDGFLAPTDPIPAASEDWGIDYEAELAIITNAVPYGTTTEGSGAHIALLMICNDVSLRNLIPAELSKGFGFVQSKPASAFSPVAVTPDELGDAWRDWRVHLRLRSYVNGILYGDPEAGAMVHGFDRLVAHAAKTRRLSAGTIIGGGTDSNAEPARGASCLVERRVMEAVEHGEPVTPFLAFGDTVLIEMLDAEGGSIFGAIEQRVEKAGG